MYFTDVTPQTAGLISSLVTSVMYGFNVIAFFACFYILMRRRASGNGVPWFIFWAAVVQFIVSTIHVGNCWRQVLEAFIWNEGTPGAAFAYYIEDPAKPTQVIGKTLVIIESFLTDSILTWRLYMIWNKNILVCIVPLATMITYIATCSVGLARLGQLPATNHDFFVISQWFLVSLGLTLVAHIFVTSLIVSKIWREAWTRTIYAGESRHMAVVWMLLESGAIYSVVVVFLVVFAALKTQVGGIISNIFVQLCELVPTLIIVRVGLGLTSDLTTRNRDHASTMIQFHRPVDAGTHEMGMITGNNTGTSLVKVYASTHLP